MKSFEDWWQEKYEKPFENVGGALKLAIKEVALNAWTASASEAYDNGYAKGREENEYPPPEYMY